MKTNFEKSKLIEFLSEKPIVSIACKSVGISRATFYRWMKRNQSFKKSIDEALTIGIQNINDLAESQLMKGVNSGEFRFVVFWLTHNKEKYRPLKASDPPKSFQDVSPVRNMMEEVKEWRDYKKKMDKKIAKRKAEK